MTQLWKYQYLIHFYNTNQTINSKKLDIKKLNNLEFNSVDLKRYPVIKLIGKVNKKNSLYETILVSANDTLVNLYLENKINFCDIHKNLKKILNNREFLKFKKKYNYVLNDIIKLNKYVNLKVKEKVYKS